MDAHADLWSMLYSPYPAAYSMTATPAHNNTFYNTHQYSYNSSPYDNYNFAESSLTFSENPASSSSPMVPTPSKGDALVTSHSSGASTSGKTTRQQQQAALKRNIASTLDESTSAQQSAMDRALAAGISRDEYERTRAGLMNMLKGTQGNNGSASTSANTSMDDLSVGPSRSSFDSLPKLLISSNSSSNKRSSSQSSNARTASSSNAPSLASMSTTDSVPSMSTLRTSVSSAATDDVFTPPQGESPPTSDDGESEKVSQYDKRRSSGEMERDTSLNAASAAAAALGMLAASPIKIDPRFANRENNRDQSGLGGPSFTQHRHVVPPSSPLMRSNSYLSSNDGYLYTSPGSRSPTRNPSSEGGKSTTPVRTRLEDIALKSSAQIRRQRERLGLGEQDEMMDMDQDARHQSQIMQSSCSLSDSENDRDVDEFDVSGSGSGLAPAFSYDANQSSPARGLGNAGHIGNGVSGPSHNGTASGHRRTPSYGMSRNQGMLDRFMEISSSPKAAQVARFEAARRSPERWMNGGYGDDERTVLREEDVDDEEEDLPLRQAALDFSVQSTPRRQFDRKAALLRSAGNDLPSPLLAQIRMLSDADYGSPARTAERPRMLESPRHLMQSSSSLQSGLGLGPPSSSLEPPGTGSARKRKASYELVSPRHRNMNYDGSQSPTSSSPPPFPTFSTASYRNSPAHPGPTRGLFGGPSAQSSQSSIDPHDRSRPARPYEQPGQRPGEMSQLLPPQHYGAQDQMQVPIYPSTRAPSVNSDYIPNLKDSRKKPKDTKKPKMERLGSVGSSASNAGNSSAPVSQSSTPTPTGFTLSTVQVGQYDAKTKPPFSYAALIGQAIFSTPNRRMSLADIYTHIMTIYPFYKKQDAGWQNSIRHNLSLNECFVKTQRAPDEPGKGCLWSVLPGTEEQFTGGNFYKKGKVPKAPSSSSKAGSSSKKSKKASSVASGTETMSVASNDDSFDTVSVNSSFSSAPMMMQHSSEHHQQQQQQHQQARVNGHYQYQQQFHHGSSGLRQQASQSQQEYQEEPEDDSFENEEGDSFDMDVPPPVPVQQYRREPEYAQPKPNNVYGHQRMASGNNSSLRHSVQREITPEAEEPAYYEQQQPDLDYDQRSYRQSEYSQGNMLSVEDSHSYATSDRSVSAEPYQEQQYVEPPPPMLQRPVAHTSPIRRNGPPPSRRALLTSPPIMSSPPTNVFARISQPYQPLRDAFNIPGQSSLHAAALMSSPPPSGITGDMRMRRLPPPTPRSSGLREEDLHASSSIFLPAPNIKPGRTSFSRKGEEEDDVFEKPTLPSIHMLSPAVAMPVNTQSPVSSIRASATKRSSSSSPKSSHTGSSGSNRSPTFNKSRLMQSAEVFKTPDRFGSTSTPRFSSPAKLAHLTNSNASRALQSMQTSTPKLGGSSRMAAGLVTPGGYYDPYEYSAVVDEELERMMAKNGDSDSHRNGDRRPLPFPSPLDRTPKWQPWSPW